MHSVIAYFVYMKPNLLVTLADKKYINQAKQLFSSVYWNSGWQGDYMLLSHEIPNDDLNWFRNKGILIKECEPLNDKTYTYYYSPVVLDKFYLFTEEFKQWKKIIFLDSDIIVKGSIEPLTKIKYFGAVQDLYFNKLSTQFFDSELNTFDNIYYDTNTPAFNSGVFSFDTSIIKPETFNNLNHIFNHNRENFRYLDQATLNLYFYKKWKKISPLFNIFVPFHNFELPKNLNYIVLHFISCPDHTQVWDTQNPYYNEWKTNLDKAELINLNNIQKVKKMSYLNIQISTFLLNIRVNNSYLLKPYIIIEHFYYVIYGNAKFITINIINLPVRILGKFGEFLKKHYPKLYYKIKGKGY